MLSAMEQTCSAPRLIHLFMPSLPCVLVSELHVTGKSNVELCHSVNSPLPIHTLWCHTNRSHPSSLYISLQSISHSHTLATSVSRYLPINHVLIREYTNSCKHWQQHGHLILSNPNPHKWYRRPCRLSVDDLLGPHGAEARRTACPVACESCCTSRDSDD